MKRTIFDGKELARVVWAGVTSKETGRAETSSLRPRSGQAAPYGSEMQNRAAPLTDCANSSFRQETASHLDCGANPSSRPSRDSQGALMTSARVS